VDRFSKQPVHFSVLMRKRGQPALRIT